MNAFGLFVLVCIVYHYIDIFLVHLEMAGIIVYEF